MKVRDVKTFAERRPFRPFAVRLTNGSEYQFNDERDFGAPKDFHMIFHFGQNEAVRIDTGSIVEIIEH